MPLDTYYTLGRSGLRVSPLALGAMTFGDPHFGCDKATSFALIDQYAEAGGNFIDTANLYAGGASEEILADYFADRGGRDRIVLATKFTMGATERDPNNSGNGRKAMLRALEGSLRRLKTDYIDLYIMHAYDGVTPAEEVMRGLDDLVRQGKVRNVAFSDVPAWYASRAQTLAQWRGFEPLCALQMQYSLVERGIEYEFPQACAELGLGFMVWSPLASGLLSGKYKPSKGALPKEQGRLTTMNDILGMFNERNWAILAEMEKVAGELGRPMAQVAVNWVANRPFVGSVILGATKPAQFSETLGALDFSLSEDQQKRLDAIGAPAPVFPYSFLNGFAAGMINPPSLKAKPPGYYGRG